MQVANAQTARMRVLIVAATPFELAGSTSAWPAVGGDAARRAGSWALEYLVTGVGPVHTGVLLTEAVLARPPSLILNIGLAGAIDRSLELGEVVHVVREEWADLGIEERDGSFTSAQALGLLDGDSPPYSAGRLHVATEPAFAKQVTALTASTVHGAAESVAALRRRSDAQVESMEGAAVFLVALRQNIPCVQLRAISNYVEPRNRDGWRIELALANLTATVSRLLASIPGGGGAARATPPRGR